MSIQMVNPDPADSDETADSYTTIHDLDDGRRVMRRERDGRTEYGIHGGRATGINHPTVSPGTGEAYGSDELPVRGPYTADELLAEVALTTEDQAEVREMVDALDR